MTAIQLIVLSLVLWFAAPVNGESVDIEVRLYQDQDCFTWYGNFGVLLLLDNGCYANVLSNASDQQKAYGVRVVEFGPVESIDLTEYSDDCHNPFASTRNIEAGSCTRFVGPYWAVITLRYRSNACYGAACSRLTVASQSFYDLSNCVGIPSSVYKYPVHNECLRWSNGTQKFLVDTSYSNITQVDYTMHDQCLPSANFIQTYTIQVGQCLPLYVTEAPRSFMWTVDYYQPFVTSVAQRSAVYPLRCLGPNRIDGFALVFATMIALLFSAIGAA